MATNGWESAEAQKKNETMGESPLGETMDDAKEEETVEITRDSETERPSHRSSTMSPSARKTLVRESMISENSVPRAPPNASPSAIDKSNHMVKPDSTSRISRRRKVWSSKLPKASSSPPSFDQRRTMVPTTDPTVIISTGELPEETSVPASASQAEGDTPKKRSSAESTQERLRPEHRHSTSVKSSDPNKTRTAPARSENLEAPSSEILLPGAYSVCNGQVDSVSPDDHDYEYDEEFGESQPSTIHTVPLEGDNTVQVDTGVDDMILVGASVPTRKPQIAAEDVKAIEAEPENPNRRKKRFMLIVIAAVVVAIVIVSVSVDSSRRSNKGGGRSDSNDEKESSIDSPGPPPFDPARLPTLQARLQEVNFPFDIPSTSKALDWLANEDGAALDFANEDAKVLAQRYAIATLYFATDGPSWTACDEILSHLPICEWNCKPDDLDYGIFCDDENDVNQLLLDGQNLSGSLPMEMLALTDLQVIEMGSNDLQGTIGPEITGLTQLKDLLLEFNSISGSIPDDINSLTQLRSLNLGANNLSGTIPSSGIGLLTGLIDLEIGSNKLTGSLPPQLGLLTNLELLSIHSTRIIGTIPSHIEKMTSLLKIRLFSNRLDGKVPSQLARLSRLTSLDLSENELSGTVPTSIASLANLTELNLGFNDLTGELDAAFCTASKEATWLEFKADCPGEVTCSCCTLCFSAR